MSILLFSRAKGKKVAREISRKISPFHRRKAAHFSRSSAAKAATLDIPQRSQLEPREQGALRQWIYRSRPFVRTHRKRKGAIGVSSRRLQEMKIVEGHYNELTMLRTYRLNLLLIFSAFLFPRVFLRRRQLPPKTGPAPFTFFPSKLSPPLPPLLLHEFHAPARRNSSSSAYNLFICLVFICIYFSHLAPSFFLHRPIYFRSPLPASAR